MKKIEAIIRQERLHSVKEALEKKGIIGMTVTEVSGRGRQKGIALQWRAGEYRVDFLPKAKLEIVLKDEECEGAIQSICETARTGKEGDGKIFVTHIENCLRIRTGDHGEIAI